MNFLETLTQPQHSITSVELDPVHKETWSPETIERFLKLGVNNFIIVNNPSRYEGMKNGEYTGMQPQDAADITTVHKQVIQQLPQHVTLMPTLIATGKDRDDIGNSLENYAKTTNNLTLLVLRGSTPKDREEYRLPYLPEENGFDTAMQLINFVRNYGREIFTEISIGAACYPEGFPGHTIDDDIERVKQKIDAGAQFFITQMFFDNKKYWDYLELLAAKNIFTPIIAGIKPLTATKHISILNQRFNCSLPWQLQNTVICSHTTHHQEKELKEAGARWATQQYTQLLQQGAPGVHFFGPSIEPILEVLELLSSPNNY